MIRLNIIIIIIIIIIVIIIIIFGVVTWEKNKWNERKYK